MLGKWRHSITGFIDDEVGYGSWFVLQSLGEAWEFNFNEDEFSDSGIWIETAPPAFFGYQDYEDTYGQEVAEKVFYALEQLRWPAIDSSIKGILHDMQRRFPDAQVSIQKKLYHAKNPAIESKTSR